MAKIKVLITVKTYPTVSTKYSELVCTAGFREDGSMIRLYPVPFRDLPFENQYKKYEWIEVDADKNTKDFRPESYRPRSEIKVTGKIAPGRAWDARKNVVLGKVYNNFEALIAEAYDEKKRTSLAVFKPSAILDFTIKPAKSKEWSRDQANRLRQLNLFNKRGNEKEPVRKLPYDFRYKFSDITGKTREILIEDWEVGALYWKMVEKYKGDEKAAIASVRNKFLDELAKKTDLHFFVGTTLQFHAKKAQNPFLIIGVFYPPIQSQMGLPGM